MAIRLVNRGTERRTRWRAWLDSLIGRALFVILRDSVMSRKRILISPYNSRDVQFIYL